MIRYKEKEFEQWSICPAKRRSFLKKVQVKAGVEDEGG